MSKEISKLTYLRDLAKLHFRRKHIIVLDPEENKDTNLGNHEDMVYDKVPWKIPNEEMTEFVRNLSNNSQLANEQKIIELYEKLCNSYVYDDNLISYIKKIDDDSFGLPDWYALNPNADWEKNREEHNRRVCYEVSRYLAASLKELFRGKEDFNVCILWDKGLTHYFVGLSCNEFSLTLDLDDFNNIKDLTRIKTGLTAQGIVILEDKNGIFEKVLKKYNSTRIPDSIQKIENEIEDTSNSKENTVENLDETSEDIIFLQNAIQILKERYSIDTQGLFEYIKEITDIKLGPESRKKVWKLIEGNNKESARCIRCLVITIDNKQYILDVDEMILREFDPEELRNDNSRFKEYREIVPRNWNTDRYDGA